jgi:short-subunit dehydrogenase
MSNELTLITGAGSGIGRELAREFARNGHSLILTARSEDDLQRLGEELAQEYGVPVRIVAADFNQGNGAQALVDALENEPIDILVNNAGLGQHGHFAAIPIEREIEILNVNIVALLVLTRAFLPHDRAAERTHPQYGFHRRIHARAPTRRLSRLEGIRSLVHGGLGHRT